MLGTRIAALGGLMALLAAPATVAGQDHDPDRAVAGGGQLPAGWMARTDRDRSLDQVKFAAADKGYRVTLGPATILYQAADTASGQYRVQATLSQLTAPSHPEAYGLFVGGTDLAGEGQQSPTS